MSPTVVPNFKQTKKPRKKASLLKECDTLFGKIVRLPGRCVSCHGTDVIQAAHGFSRRYRAVRWDERNCFPLCRAEHVYFTHRPLEWDAWLRETWGESLYTELRVLAMTGPNPLLKDVLERLRLRWSELEGAA